MSAFTHRVVSSAFAFVRGPAVYGIRIGALAERRRSVLETVHLEVLVSTFHLKLYMT